MALLAISYDCVALNHGVNMSLCRRLAPRYVESMRQLQPTSLATTAGIALGVAAFAAMTGLAFAAWLDNGASIFLSLVDAGMSWCF